MGDLCITYTYGKEVHHNKEGGQARQSSDYCSSTFIGRAPQAWYNSATDNRDQGENTMSERKMIDSPRYVPTGSVLGRGTWGVVIEARDTATGEMAALKVLQPTETARAQMRSRKITPFEALRNEGDLSPCANIVPRTFEIDSRGTPFIRMPVYYDFLDRAIKRGDAKERAIPYLEDIANGLYEIHSVRGRVHGDLKPDNIALGNGKALISDLGTSTCASFGWTVSPRDNMGCAYTRAPECFRENSHPTSQSDVWAFGALASKLLTGEYPFEADLDKGDRSFVQSKERFNSQLESHLAKLPREHKKLRKLLRGCLAYDQHQRPYNGEELKARLGEALAKNSFGNLARDSINALKKVGIPAVVGTLALMGVYSIGSLMATSSDKINPPPKIRGLLYFDEASKGAPGFEAEAIAGLPGVIDGFMIHGQSDLAKKVTSDRNVAYLVNCFGNTVMANGLIYTPRDIEGYQQRIFDEMTSPEEKKRIEINDLPHLHVRTASAIKHAIDTLKRKDGSIDLEDVCVMSTLGKDALDDAKKYSGSGNYERYRDATYPDGTKFFDKYERNFLDYFISEVHKN